MDTSKEYIEMCSKATEIQEMKILKDTKSFFVEGELELLGRREYASYYTNKIIWLPRQDQLQEIVKSTIDPDFYFNTQSLIACFDEFIENNVELDDMSLTFEQLWLSVAMKEKYNKKWNNTTKNWEQNLQS